MSTEASAAHHRNPAKSPPSHALQSRRATPPDIIVTSAGAITPPTGGADALPRERTLEITADPCGPDAEQPGGTMSVAPP